MNDVINKLSDIEQASVNIMDSANARKKEIAAQMADKTSSFDAQIQADTAKKLADLRAQMEVICKPSCLSRNLMLRRPYGRWRTVMLPITQNMHRLSFEL